MDSPDYQEKKELPDCLDSPVLLELLDFVELKEKLASTELMEIVESPVLLDFQVFLELLVPLESLDLAIQVRLGILEPRENVEMTDIQELLDCQEGMDFLEPQDIPANPEWLVSMVHLDLKDH